ncbi:MAG: hypothetical protein N3E37_05265, partial [Candidatus Micrarchaeota archaeon]|nr:hypothetical protein [Candidatus Micrarchaeota archaeon]
VVIMPDNKEQKKVVIYSLEISSKNDFNSLLQFCKERNCVLSIYNKKITKEELKVAIAYYRSLPKKLYSSFLVFLACMLASKKNYGVLLNEIKENFPQIKNTLKLIAFASDDSCIKEFLKSVSIKFSLEEIVSDFDRSSFEELTLFYLDLLL